MKTPKTLYYKAIKLKKRLSPEEEQIISTSPVYSYFYAKEVIKKRLPELEKRIKEHDIYWKDYKDHFKQEFELEEILNS